MKQITLFLLFLLSAAAVELHAQATLTYQGIIKNADGTAVDDGKYPITFQLYDVASGGTAVWSETQPQVTLKGGIYSVVLGSVTPIDAAFDQTYYLGVAVDGGAELVPRTQLTAAPYALSLLGNSNVFPNDGNVGIGTTDPLEALHVVGNVKIEGNLETTGSGGSVAFDSLTVDIKTTENITAGGDVKVADTLFAAGFEAPFRIITGSVDHDGTILSGTGFTVEILPNSNLKKVTFDQSFSSAPTIHLTDYFGLHHLAVANPTTTDFSVSAYRINGGNFESAHFSFIAIGPR